MTDGDALYRAILETPACDTARPVYADWLEENGQAERSEFIRVQVELAAGWADHSDLSHQGYGDLCRGCVLRRRERELWLTLYGKLASEVNRHLLKPRSTADGCSMRWHLDGGTGEMVTTWARGFVWEVRLSAAAFLGGVCERCGGFGGRHSYESQLDRRCPACEGTGRTPGLAKELFANHPITKVVVGDDMPLFPSGGNGTYYVGNLGMFPRKYWSRLEGLPSRKAAEDARDAALVAHGRREAGLPPLTNTANILWPNPVL